LKSKRYPLDLLALKENQDNNSKNLIPLEFYNINNYNNISFIIYDHLNSAFKSCFQLLKKNEINKYYNFIALFYHHINSILCSYYFCLYELELVDSDNKEILFSDHMKEWSIGYSQIVSSNYDYKVGDNSLSVKSQLKRFMKWFKKHNRAKGNTKIFLHPHGDLNLLSLQRLLKKENINSTKSLNEFPKKVKIRLFKKQLKILFNEISKLISNMHIRSVLNAKELNEIIYNRIKPHIHFNEEKKINFDLAILDSLGDLESRKIAMQCRLQDIPVMGIAHGESSGIMDEPVFGIVEQTYCNYYLGYGELGCKSLKKGKYTRSFFNDSIKLIPSNSNKILKIFKSSYIDKIENYSSKTLMYVPTSFNGNARYGPFRDIQDLAYMNWQKDLLKSTLSLLKPKKLFIKYHPKDRLDFFINMENVDIINKGNFFNYINKADAFIFDFPGSAFSLALATSRPVFYMDIGLRNLNSFVLKKIKERCVYIKTNPAKADNAVSKILTDIFEEKRNSYTKNFCLGDKEQKREETVKNAIQKYLLFKN
tara:strand:+ start:2640 stop:4250 length:1611 start_codon:yes stop_codon:yes gene_type:complete